jgi:hypothetical protein
MATRFNPQSDQPAGHPRPGSSAVVLAGGSAITLGSLMPFVSFSGIGLGIDGGPKVTSGLFGLIVIALAIMLHRAVQQPARRITGLAAVFLSGLGALGYTSFIALGILGLPQQDSLGDSYTVTFSPAIGVLLSVAGCVAAFYAAIRSLQDHES